MDYQALMNALVSLVTTSKVIMEVKGTLSLLSLENQVWVPGRSGIEGNQKAVELVRKGSSTPSIGPEPFLLISHGLCGRAVRDWTRVECASQWRSYAEGVHTKRFSRNQTRNGLGIC